MGWSLALALRDAPPSTPTSTRGVRQHAIAIACEYADVLDSAFLQAIYIYIYIKYIVYIINTLLPCCGRAGFFASLDSRR